MVWKVVSSSRIGVLCLYSDYFRNVGRYVDHIHDIATINIWRESSNSEQLRL